MTNCNSNDKEFIIFPNSSKFCIVLQEHKHFPQENKGTSYTYQNFLTVTDKLPGQRYRTAERDIHYRLTREEHPHTHTHTSKRKKNKNYFMG